MRIIADENIPFLEGRLEPFAEMTYTDQFGFTPELVRDADALLIRTRTRCDASLLEGSRVRLIATATIGTDQIDIPWCSSHGITVRNAPGCNAPGVAQYVWSTLLRCGFNPATSTLGVVGKGNVGRIVTEWGRRFGAKVIVCDPFRKEEGMTDEEYLPLKVLLSRCDAVTLHTPLTRNGQHPTLGLVGPEELRCLRDGALLVNAARGGVVREEALKEELKRGRLRAVIDTWEREPEIDRELLSLVECGTFHIAGYSRQGKQRATRMVLEAVADHFGITPSLDGLEGEYHEPEGLSPLAVTHSYDPMEDFLPLRDNPELFDRLRHDYNFRGETGSL